MVSGLKVPPVGRTQEEGVVSVRARAEKTQGVAPDQRIERFTVDAWGGERGWSLWETL